MNGLYLYGALSLAALLVACLFFLPSGEGGVPELTVSVTDAESQHAIGRDAYVPTKQPSYQIPCFDPATMDFLGTMPAMKAPEVRKRIEKAKAAGKAWRQSSFRQRRLLLRTLQKYILDNQETICRVSARDSGKPMVDAAFGEVMVTCEKISWLLKEGERWLKPEHRSAGAMMFYKAARVEYHPLGVVGAIVPWNYPFHNVFNPLVAALFAGNALIIKVSEHASWSSQYYGRVITAALAAVGAHPDLVQIVTGYAEAGNALVTGGVDKLIFVGSTEIGKKVMAAAAETLTPVVLELGGKDAFIVCDDADLSQAVPTALRGAFQSCGQNCAGAERFLVQPKAYDGFVRGVVAAASKLRQGPPLGEAPVDAGAMCMPGLAAKVGELVDDARNKGAQVLVGGSEVKGRKGQFFQPTVLVGVTPDMRIWQEEVFGPVLVVRKVADDEEAVAAANDCPFGLGSAVFSRSIKRARAIAERLDAGMTSINDFATTYMCQSLPFGGVKASGFDRFAGIEGLRGLCVTKSVCEDRVPWLLRTDIPPLLQYPVGNKAFPFVCGLIKIFYSLTWSGSAKGVLQILGALLPGWKQRQ